MSDNTTSPVVRRSTNGKASVFLSLCALLAAQSGCVTKKPQTSSTPVMVPTTLPQASALPAEVAAVPRMSEGQGLLWFPFVWSPQLAKPTTESGLTTVEQLYLRDPKLVLRNTTTKLETLISLREELGGEKTRYALSQKDPQAQLRFYLPRVMSLAQGEYTVEGIRLEIGAQPQERGTAVNMPFVNPFQPSNNKPLMFKVREGAVATIARVVQTTSFAQAAQGLSLKTVSENVDSDVVPVGLVFHHLNKSGADASISIVAGTSDFPRMRLDLTDDKGTSRAFEEKFAKVGFLVDSPCKAEGSVRLVWKRQNDEKEYLTWFPVKAGDQTCQDKRSQGFVFNMPSGDWILKSTMIVPSGSLQHQLQTPWLTSPSAALREYFSLNLNQFNWTLETQKEREIRKALLLPLESSSRRLIELRQTRNVYRVGRSAVDSEVLFLGNFEIRVGEAKNDQAAVWDFVLKSNFDLQQAQTLLSSNDVFNAYTLEKITAGRSKNTSIILRTAAEQDDRPNVAPVASELQSEAKKAYEYCVREREETDPLVNLNGLLQFIVLKGSDSVNLRSRLASKDIYTENWLESCLKKKLLSFRFSRKAPVNFQGELKFGNQN